MTPKQLQIKKGKGLCYHRVEKYIVDHLCKKLFQIELLWEDDTQKVDISEPMIEVLEIDSHALKISFQCHMRVNHFSHNEVIKHDSKKINCSTTGIWEFA